MYYKTCTKPLLYQKRHAQSISHYYFVLQSLHKVLPSTTSYHSTCTKYFPALLCTTKMHKRLPSTTSYYTVCAKDFPVLLHTCQYASTTSHYEACTSQYYFVLQSLHNVFPNTTSYYKACTKYFPVLLRTTKLAQCISQYSLVIQSFYIEKLLHTEAFAHKRFTHRKTVTQQSIFTHRSF